jgi:ubiquinone/menaquinone biosynthesis C-methylase UbiE
MSDQQIKTQLEYYDYQTEDYEKGRLIKRGLNRASKRKAKIIFKEINKLNATKIIEIGAGSGLVSYYLSQFFKGEIVLLDLSNEMLEMAKNRIKNPKVSFVVGDGTKTEFPDNYFDAVVGVDIIHHLYDPVIAMQEWKRIVKHSGKMVFLETNAYNPLVVRHIGLEHEVRAFLNTDKNLGKWSLEAGWEQVSVKPAPSFTPASPAFLGPFFDIIDFVSVRIPLFKKIAALWFISNTKK